MIEYTRIRGIQRRYTFSTNYRFFEGHAQGDGGVLVLLFLTKIGDAIAREVGADSRHED